MKKLFCVFLLLAVTGFGQVSWSSQAPAGVSDDIWCVKYANGTFVAVTGQGRVLTSTDGLSWGVQTVAQGTWLVSVAYGGGLWVVVGAGGSIYYSADLNNWTAAKAVTNTRLNGVAYAGTTFLAVGESGIMATSPDAQNWTLRASGTSNFLHGIVAQSINASTGAFWVSGGAGTFLYSTNNGVTWNSGRLTPNGSTDDLEAIALSTPPTGQTQRVIAAGSNGLTFAGNFSSMSSPPAYASFGSTTQNLASKARFRGLVYGGNSWVAAGELGTIYTSSDGTAWVQRYSSDSPSTATTNTFLGVEYAPTLQRFVAVGTGGTLIVSSGPATNMVNVSTRGTVVPTDPVIGGFVISGTSQKNVLIRAVGPTLSNFGVSKPLADPVMSVYNSSNTLVATNAAWGSNSNLTALVAATLQSTWPLTSNSKDAALYMTLSPGSYTAIITSASASTGTVLFEAYSP